MEQAPSYAARKSLYASQWASMVIEVQASVDVAARKLLASKARYEEVEKGTGVPWFFIACIHWREASGDFRCVLHNGERIVGTSKKTKLVPAGRGPFATFEAAAIDALHTPPHDMRAITDWSVTRFAYEAEKWNGWGYALYHPKNPSAYLWSMSSAYKGGKYVADGKWSATALDSQVGVMPLLKRMMELDASIKFPGQADTAPAPQPSPAPPVPEPHPEPTDLPEPAQPAPKPAGPRPSRLASVR